MTFTNTTYAANSGTATVGVSVLDNLTITLGSLASAGDQVSFPQISYTNKENPEQQTYTGVRIYTTTTDSTIAVTMTSVPSNPGSNPYLVDGGNESSRIYYSVRLDSCHPAATQSTILNLADNIPALIDFPNSYRSNCFSFLGGDTGTLTFTRLGIAGPLPNAGTYSGTVTFTVNEA